MSTFRIDDEHGNEICTGLPEYRVRAVAQGGHYPAGECSCGRKGADICCTFASYPDGSTDGPTCSACCTARHGHRARYGYEPELD